MRLRISWILATFLIWAVSPGRADAHLVNSGLGPFYDGLAHLFVTPEDLLITLALALMAGMRGREFGRAVLFVLPAAWLVGTFAGRVFALSSGVAALSAALLIVLGVLVAMDRRLPLPLVAGFALICGLVNGCFNGAALAEVGFSQAAVGIGCAVFMVVALVAGQVTTVRTTWTRIALRVGGSWISAVGLLMFGWAMRQS